jgi:hypothetical protein
LTSGDQLVSVFFLDYYFLSFFIERKNIIGTPTTTAHHNEHRPTAGKYILHAHPITLGG